MHSNHRGAILSACIALLFVGGLAAAGQAPDAPPSQAAPAKNSAHARGTDEPDAKPISEEDLRRRFQGKTLYLRGGYSENELRFDEHGKLVSTSPQVSYTLSMVEIGKVHMSKRKVQLEGIRYGIHFLGTSPGEDPFTASDKVRISSKKKLLRITIERAQVSAPKKSKKLKSDVPLPAPETEGTVVRSHVEANQILDQAVDRIFSDGLDGRMLAALPAYWKFYYQAAETKSVWKPSDPSVLRQTAVDRKAQLITNFQPPSNDFAQNAGVAGVAQYHVVVGADGKATDIAVGRPIGFGLDESAVASIQRATFQPAIKDGKPVPVTLDLLVEFRIYSKRTGASSPVEAAGAIVNEPQAPSLPGPYTANQPPTRQQ